MMCDMDYSPLAHDLLTLRYRAGLDQADLAAALGFGADKISRYETGKSRPSAARYKLIRDYLMALISGDEARAQEIAAQSPARVAKDAQSGHGGEAA